MPPTRQTGQLGQYETEVASLRQQLDQLLDRQRHLEADNSRLQVTPDQVKRSLLHLAVTEERYQELVKMDADEMSLKDFAAVSGRVELLLSESVLSEGAVSETCCGFLLSKIPVLA